MRMKGSETEEMKTFGDRNSFPLSSGFITISSCNSRRNKTKFEF